MANTIQQFQTITRHRSYVQQSPTVIECLTSVLNYIKEVLEDDGTQEIIDELQQHIDTKDISAHYFNADLLDQQIISALRYTFVSLGIYVDPKINHDAYNVPDYVPLDHEDFIRWLIDNPDDYDGETTGLSLQLIQAWFTQHHDDVLTVHDNTLMNELDERIGKCSISPSYEFDTQNFDASFYLLMDSTDYDNLMTLVGIQLVALGSPLTIDYVTYPDTATVEGAGGDGGFTGYTTLLEDCGETDTNLIPRKFLDYYVDHLRFVLTDDMTPEYEASMTEARSSVNTNYTKAFHVHTILNRNNFSINVKLGLWHLVEGRTLDLINLVGLSKSVCCLCLVPYIGPYNNTLNKLVISFDNYNPDFTAVLINAIDDGDLYQPDIVISASHETLSVYIGLGDVSNEVHFDNVNRTFDVDPYFLFVSPRIADHHRDMTRITDLSLYGKAMSQNDALITISNLRRF